MKIDLAKRRRMMERSRRLGHCICDVRRPCPCDVFRNDGICPCAGERPDPVDAAQVRLMQWVRNAGCASKIAPADLDVVLARLPAVNDPAVISGLAAADDAAIYRLTDNLCLVQTVDVFTPCVDDARLFGKICAANCLSDIYAMGGTPRTALSVLAFPSEKLPGEIVFQMLSGAMETFQEAGVALVGGHSVKDDEIKLGFAITGVIDPAVATALEKPNAGDALVLTKPLGTGVLTFAKQIGRDYPEGLAAAEISMATLNRAAADAMKETGASACTDVTGFGLFAHLHRMLRTTGLGAEIFAESLPAFPGATEALRQGVIPGAVERNREYVGEAIRVAPDVDEALINLGFDAQTSGGLLIAVPRERLELLRQSLARSGAGAFVIGKVTAGANGQIAIVPGNAERGQPCPRFSAPSSQPADMAVRAPDSTETKSMNTSTPDSAAGHEACCADIFKTGAAQGSAADSQKAFGALLRSVQADGVLNAKAKELILFTLVVASRCQPCFDAHFRRARELGITQAELDEAAWCAIAMGGAPVKMFYQESLGKMLKAEG
jgi:selenide, water dikinase